MEIFFALLALCEENPREVPLSFGVFLVYAWINRWKSSELAVVWGTKMFMWRHCNVKSSPHLPVRESFYIYGLDWRLHFDIGSHANQCALIGFWNNQKHLMVYQTQRHMKSRWVSLFGNMKPEFEGMLPKGPYPPCLRMADRVLLAGYPRIVRSYWRPWSTSRHRIWIRIVSQSYHFDHAVVLFTNWLILISL